jgi:predicted Zn-dependent protease with MMP-like domain
MKDKDRYWDCLDHAMEASQGGRNEEALDWLDEALKADPNGAEAHNSRGEILWDEGKVDEALYEFELSSLADPKFTQAHLNRAEILIEEIFECEQAIQLCDDLLRGKPELPRLDRGLEAEVHYLKSKALFYLDDLEGSLFLVRRAIKTGGEQPLYRAFEGQLLFELTRFAEARQVLERSVAMDPESAHAAYHLALTLERLGEDAEAERAFAKADALNPEQFGRPTVISEEEFKGAADEALANLPRSIRAYTEQVPVLVEDWPSVEFCAEHDASPQILGIFLGVPRTAAMATDQPQDLDRVILFKRNLEKVCRSRDELIDQIQVTVKHEIGHYLGLDEDDLERLGLA